MSARAAAGRFASRAGDKLNAALDAFDIDVADLRCADFGCNVGGFTDCLLQRGAPRVYAIDTGYGALDWKLRKDDRVVVMERTNALHAEPAGPADFAVIDVAWTPQQRIVPAAARWLVPPDDDSPPLPGRIVSLLKPHYEWAKLHGKRPIKPLSDRESDEVCREVCAGLEQAGFRVRAAMRSVLRGKGGNVEFMLLIE